MPTTVDGSLGVGYPNGGTQAGAALGEGQTWQDVTATRALGTTYTNTTGRPITVAFTIQTINAAAGNFTVNGVVVGRVRNGNASAVTCQITAVVPIGGAYVFTNTAGTPVLEFWAELR